MNLKQMQRNNFRKASTLEHFCSDLLLNTDLNKLHFLQALVNNRLNQVWQHATHCPYLVDNPKHGHLNLPGKY